MGRKASGWTIKQAKEGHAFRVRFTWAGEKHNINTGTCDPELASSEAARLYAEVVSRAPKPKPRSGHTQALEGLTERWLVSLLATHDPRTIKTWKLYVETHFLNFFTGLHDLTDQRGLSYRNARLLKVQKETVKRELSALRSFLAWLYGNGPEGEAKPGHGYLPVPVVVRGPERNHRGVVYEKRRRSKAQEISPDEVKQIIGALPEWSESKKVARFPVQARFIVAYETSLRPETLDLLSVPEHYGPGRDEIVIVYWIDKAKKEREVPLTAAARAALDSVCPKEGLIFGHHDYRNQLRKAVKDALPAHRAALFTGAHFRSARITHWLETTQNIAGAQHMAGHSQMSTTARYVKPSKRAALQLLVDDGAARLPGAPVPKQLPAHEPAAE
jgi:integrase